MQLIKQNGHYIAKTQYGEWQAKNAGFKWDSIQRVWRTDDPQKAKALESVMGLTFELPPPPTAPQGDLWPTVIDGRYAIVDPQDGTLKFFQVDKPKEGRWVGWTFLKVMASDNTWPVKDHAHKKLVLDAIAKDPMGAMAKYGQMIGSCGYCGRTLTDAVSRHIGIGPVCRKHLHYEEE